MLRGGYKRYILLYNKICRTSSDRTRPLFGLCSMLFFTIGKHGYVFTAAARYDEIVNNNNTMPARVQWPNTNNT